MTEEPRPVTVSIVSHGQWKIAQPLLEQLSIHCGAVIQKVVVTLNVPEPVAPVEASFELQILRNRSPQGFGSNHNQAFAQATTPWFLVLNPDIRVPGDVLTPMLTAAGSGAGLLAPRILEPGRNAPEAHRGLLTPLELVRRRTASYNPPKDPVWVAGMFMLLRSAAYRDVGGFDERFFMYCEDFDLCARLQLHGWDIRSAEHVCVLHEAQRASNRSLRPLLWHLRSFGQVWLSPTFWRYSTLLRRRSGEQC